MNGQKNILSIIIAVVITVFGCYFFLPSYSSKQLEISYETTLQQNKKDYEKQIKSLETEILTLEKNVDYYIDDRYYKDIESFLLKHAIKHSTNTKELFINHQFFSCMYNGNIKCYTLDGELVKCLIAISGPSINQNCFKKSNCSICNLIATTEHSIRKISQIENNVIKEISKNEKG